MYKSMDTNGPTVHQPKRWDQYMVAHCTKWSLTECHLAQGLKTSLPICMVVGRVAQKVPWIFSFFNFTNHHHQNELQLYISSLESMSSLKKYPSTEPLNDRVVAHHEQPAEPTFVIFPWRFHSSMCS